MNEQHNVSKCHQKYTTAILISIVGLSEVSYQMVLPLFPQLIVVFSHYSVLGVTLSIESLYGTLMALFPLAVVISAPVLGYCSDRFGRKPLLLTTLSMMGLAYAMMSVAIYEKSYLLFVLGRIAGGIGATCTAISQAALSDRYPPQTRAKQFGLVGLALTIAMMVGPAISKLLTNSHWSRWLSVTTPLYFCLCLSLCSAVLVLFLFQDTQVKSEVSINKPYHHALRYLLVFLIMEVAWSYYFHFTMLTMIKYHHQHTTTYLIFIGVIMSWALTIGYRALERRLSVEQILLIGLGLIWFFLATINFVTSLEGIYLNVIPIAIGTAFTYSASLTLTTKVNNPALQGFMLGSSLSMMALAWAATGFCVSHSFPGHMVLLSSIVIALVTIGILMTTTGKSRYA